jgi:4-hydroxybenzoate polyprenyltransferase
MEAKNETPPPIIDQLKDYAETRIKLAKYQAIEGGTSIAAGLIADVAVFISSVLAFIFASVTLALYLGKVLGAYWAGFGCVAIIYLMIALVVKANKKKLEKPIVNAIIQKIFNN